MKKLVFFFVLFPVLVLAQSTNQNFVKSITYKSPLIDYISTASPPASEAEINVTYIDGLGRSIQQVAHKQSGTGNDIITPIVYDIYGRQPKEYLPLPSQSSTMNYTADASLLPSIETYYLNQFGAEGGNPFSEKRFEASPLSKVLEQGAPGTSWAVNPTSDSDHTIKFEYGTNTERIIYLKAVAGGITDGAYSISISNVGYYEVNQLYKTITKDENWGGGTTKNRTVEEFKNQQGQVVLKRTYESSFVHDTYYVYDQFGNLTYVLPPKAGPRTNVLNDLCYQYKYDHRNRLVEKKLPGKQWEFIVYDQLDRVVATGPANIPFEDLEKKGKIGWLVTKYDALNRPVLTAWKEANAITSAARNTLQNSYNAQTVLSESRLSSSSSVTTINGVVFNYSNLAEPKINYDLLTVNYYDDYDFTADNSWVPTALPTTSLGKPVHYNRTLKPKGLPTGSWVRVIENSANYRNEVSYILYDSRSRPVFTYKRNHVLGSDLIYTLFDFESKVVQTQQVHKRLGNSPQPLTVNDYFTYTDQGRLLEHKHKVNGNPEEVIVHNDYDVLGQLATKKVGGLAGVELQKVDYSYTIRGWLKQINNIDQLDQGSSVPKDLFAFKISYDDGANAVFNGNISETYWRTASDDILRKYDYSYDALNRLNSAFYSKPGVVDAFYAYNEGITYDNNGNIAYLYRYGYSDGDVTNNYLIDNLTYTYRNDSNRLTKVIDDSHSLDGFKDGQDPDDPNKDDYHYDLNGNMTVDWNKGIKEIQYNHLNLPMQIDFKVYSGEKFIHYLYTALGVKVGKFVRNNSPDGEQMNINTDYLNGFQYLDTELQFFPTAEGYVSVTNGDKFNYVYNYLDHLGNIRLSYTQEGSEVKIVEENHYYPFGMKHSYNSSIREWGQGIGGTHYAILRPVVRNKNQYKYNGKEYQDELNLNWYDYQARNYDPAIGRWMNMDPLAETSRRFSPYTYCLNNPVYFIDPDGMEARVPSMIDIPSSLLEPNEIRTDGYGRRLDGAAFDFVDYRPSESRNERNDQEDPKKRKLTPEQQKKLDQMLYEQKMAWEGFEVIYDDNPFSALGHQLSFAMPSARFSGLFSIFSKGSKTTEVVAKTSSNVLLNTSKQLQAKFKHAGDFGVIGNYNKANAGKFSSAINQHINSAGVQTIQGTYRGQSVIHYVNPNTGLNVISSPTGQFMSGWKLNPAQLQNVLIHGGL